MVDHNARTLSARDLLHLFLKLRKLAPDLADWSEERLSDNPPRLYRLQQLMALFRAFEIDWDPSSFVEGKFIRPKTRYAALLKTMVSTMPEGRTHCLGANNHQLRSCFKILFKYRERVEEVLSFSSGLIEASGLYLYAHEKAGELNRIIRDNVAIVEDVLVGIISPEAKVFSVDQLARDYGYPDVNLFEIDEDWL